MILVRSDSGSSVFLVREGEEVAAMESLRGSYPGWSVSLVQRAAGLILLRVAPDGAAPADDRLAIGRVELRRRGARS